MTKAVWFTINRWLDLKIIGVSGGGGLLISSRNFTILEIGIIAKPKHFVSRLGLFLSTEQVSILEFSTVVGVGIELFIKKVFMEDISFFLQMSSSTLQPLSIEIYGKI